MQKDKNEIGDGGDDMLEHEELVTQSSTVSEFLV